MLVVRLHLDLSLDLLLYMSSRVRYGIVLNSEEAYCKEKGQFLSPVYFLAVAFQMNS